MASCVCAFERIIQRYTVCCTFTSRFSPSTFSSAPHVVQDSEIERFSARRRSQIRTLKKHIAYTFFYCLYVLAVCRMSYMLQECVTHNNTARQFVWHKFDVSTRCVDCIRMRTMNMACMCLFCTGILKHIITCNVGGGGVGGGYRNNASNHWNCASIKSKWCVFYTTLVNVVSCATLKCI